MDAEPRLLQALLLAQQWQLQQHEQWAPVARYFAQQAPRVRWQTDHLVFEFPLKRYAFFKNHVTYSRHGGARKQDAGTMRVQTMREDSICLVFVVDSGGKIEVELKRVGADVWRLSSDPVCHIPSALALPIQQALQAARAAWQ